MADPTETGVGGIDVTPPSAAPVATPKPPDEGATPEEELRFTKKAFNERKTQAERAGELRALKALGFESAEAALAFKKAADERAAAEEQRKLAEMSELERLKAEIKARDEKLAAEKARADAAAEEAEFARMEAKLQGLYAERGITATKYAEWLIDEAIQKLPDGELLDEVAFLDGLIKDPAEAARLGIKTAAPTVVVNPAKTTTTPKGPDPKTPGATGKGRVPRTQAEHEAWKNDPYA